MTAITAILCAALSGVALYFSCGLGGSLATTPGMLWAVALLAPIPVLWFAFGPHKLWVVAVTAFAAMLLGTANILPAYAGVLPLPVLVLATTLPALAFTAATIGARFVAQRVAPISGVIAFAALSTGFDYLLSQGPNGAATSPAYSQLELPWMIQGASVFGLWAITAVMGLFAAGLAMGLAKRQASFVLFAAAVLALNLGYGHWRLATAPKGTIVRVGLAGNDSLIGAGLKDDEAQALAVAKAYAAAGRSLAQQEANLIVFPEKIAVLRPTWAGPVNAEFETLAHIGHALVVVGVDARGTDRQNQALVYFANGATPQSYSKRRLVPGLERAFVPGSKSFMLGDRTGVAICKDMDFPALLHNDAILEPTLYAVPAWDFDKDAVWHARIAILRGVENGFAVARAANDGLLTLSDAYGRVQAVKKTAGGGMVTLRGDLQRGPGRTLYASIGDGLAYLCLALGTLLLGVAVLAKKQTDRM
jgi:apolipoprotein N-acyltransferase